MNTNLTEKLIQKALWELWQSHPYKIVNSFYFNSEQDWLSFLTSLYCYEAEIKISRSDFRADFKKKKHKEFEACLKSKKIAVQKEGEWKVDRRRDSVINMELTEIRSYERFNRQTGAIIANETFTETIGTRIRYIDTTGKRLPNRFWFATPEAMVKKEEVPKHAGLIYVTEEGEAYIAKRAPLLHNYIHDPKKSFKKFYRAYESAVISNLFNY